MQKLRFLASYNGLPLMTRRCLSGRKNAVLKGHYQYLSFSSCGGSSAVRETIAPEMLTIEILPAVDDHSGRNSSEIHMERDTQGEWDDTNNCSSDRSVYSDLKQKQYWDVTSIDNFAKSRVLNYVRRTGNKSSDVFEVCREQMFGRTVYRARCKLFLPPPHHFYVAEGVAEDEKDAELLAAMHAERICDAFGVPLFRLPSMQQKHAENAKRQGRYAPMPGDPIKPEGTIAPPPLRMVTHTPCCNSAGAATTTAADALNFLTTVAEAEIIDDKRTTCKGNHCTLVTEIDKKAEDNKMVYVSSVISSDASVMSAKNMEVTAMDTSEKPPYHTTVHYPWLSFTSFDGVTGGTKTTSTTSGGSGGGSKTLTTTAAYFDPTENGMWQMVNVNSTRCSPSPDALLLPCVYENAAYERMKDHFLQHGMVIKERTTISHVTVAGHSARMYVAEIRLHDSIVGRGKAQTKECAEHLAAMHAELLLDALARPLFPKDNQRQAKHAVAVERFGRWAPNPLSGDMQHPQPHDPLPLPLKQQVGGDEVWLDPQMIHRYSYQRSPGERMIAAHNEVNNYCGDYIETNPDPKLLVEARELLEKWQREIARNPCPDMFVITRMGDQFRASTLLPVPRAFGVRGGNAVGKTIDQAIGLSALHAVDTLCALGIPLFADPVQQHAFIEKRRRMGLVTIDDMQQISSGKGLVAILAPSLAEVEAESASTSASEKKGFFPYLPGYMVEGNQSRPLPHICDTLHVLQLRIPEDFTVYGADVSDEEIIDAGNEAKVCVQNYLRYHMPKNTNVNASVYITGYGRQVSVHNIAYLPLVLPNARRDTIPEKTTSKKKKKKAQNPNSEHQENVEKDGETVPSSCPHDNKEKNDFHCENGEEKEMTQGNAERLLAVGISLKKKDAERMCYLHAVDILRSLGQDVLTNYRAGLPRRKSPPSTSQSPATPPRADTGDGEDNNTSRKDCGGIERGDVGFKKLLQLKPYMHKLMMQFMTSGRHYTPPKRRLQQGPAFPRV